MDDEMKRAFAAVRRLAKVYEVLSAYDPEAWPAGAVRADYGGTEGRWYLHLPDRTVATAGGEAAHLGQAAQDQIAALVQWLRNQIDELAAQKDAANAAFDALIQAAED